MRVVVRRRARGRRVKGKRITQSSSFCRQRRERKRCRSGSGRRRGKEKRKKKINWGKKKSCKGQKSNKWE